MITAPTYDGQQVSPSPAGIIPFNASASPAASGAALGAGLSAAAQDFAGVNVHNAAVAEARARAIAQQKAQIDSLVLGKARLALRQAGDDAEYGPNGFRKYALSEALAGADAASAAYDKREAEIAGSLDAGQREQLAEWAGTHRLDRRVAAEKYAAAETDRATDMALEDADASIFSGLVRKSDGIAFAPSAVNPGEFELDDSVALAAINEYEQELHSHYAGNAHRIGEPEGQWVAKRSKAFAAKVHGQALRGILAGENDRLAEAYLDRHKDELSDNDRILFERDVAAANAVGVRERGSEAAFAAHFDAGAVDTGKATLPEQKGAAIASVRADDSLSPDERADIVKLTAARFDEAGEQRDAVQKANRDGFVELLHVPPAERVAVFASFAKSVEFLRLPSAMRDEIADFAKDGPAVSGDLMEWGKLRMMIDDPARSDEAMAHDFYGDYMRGAITDPEYRAFVKDVGTLNGAAAGGRGSSGGGGGKGDPLLDTFYSEPQSVHDIYFVSRGWDLNYSPTGKDGVDYVKYLQSVSAAQASAQVAGKEKVVGEGIREIARAQVLQSVQTPDGEVSFGKPVYQLTVSDIKGKHIPNAKVAQIVRRLEAQGNFDPTGDDIAEVYIGDLKIGGIATPTDAQDEADAAAAMAEIAADRAFAEASAQQAASEADLRRLAADRAANLISPNDYPDTPEAAAALEAAIAERGEGRKPLTDITLRDAEAARAEAARDAASRKKYDERR